MRRPRSLRSSSPVWLSAAVAIAGASVACGARTSASGDAAAVVDTSQTADASDAQLGGRDWSAHPAIAQLDGVTEVWALSDIHGDNAALITLLTGAKLIDAGQHWVGGTAVLVIVGDMIDKGPDAVAVVRTLIALQASAAAAGGQVVVTMGNHEAEFLADPTNSKASGPNGFDGELTAAGLSPAATAAGSDDIGVMLRDLPFAARVDDWFFVHAGDTGGLTLDALATALRAGVDASGFGAPVLSGPTSLLEHKFPTSIFWEQGSGAPATTLATDAQALGANHIVMGHEPVGVTFADGVKRPADKMFQRYGRIFLIDTGMSVGADHTGGALLHIPNPGDATTAEVVTPNGKHALLVAK